jgi:hypothetical protein
MFLYASILFLIAIFCQLIVGSLAMSKKIKFSFGWLTLINCVFISLITYVLMKLSVPEKEGPKCGMLQMGAVLFGLATLALHLFIVILQLLWISVIKSK